MVEISTVQRGSNFLLEEGGSFENSSYLGGTNSTPVVPTDSLVNKTLISVTSADDDSWILQGTDVPQLGLSESLPSVGLIVIPWGQIPNAGSPVALGSLGKSDHRIYWGCNYGLRAQDSSMPEAFARHGADGSGVLTMMLEDVESAIAWKYAALLSYLREGKREWRKTAVSDPGQKVLATELRASFEDSPVEDGMGHPAERIIAKTLAQVGDKRALRWLKDFCVDVSQPVFAASVLRCLARNDSIGTTSWRGDIVRDSLASDSVEMRDAAIQAVETWGDLSLLEPLRAHSDPEPWLQQYVLDVIDDLSE